MDRGVVRLLQAVRVMADPEDGIPRKPSYIGGQGYASQYPGVYQRRATDAEMKASRVRLLSQSDEEHAAKKAQLGLGPRRRFRVIPKEPPSGSAQAPEPEEAGEASSIDILEENDPKNLSLKPYDDLHLLLSIFNGAIEADVPEGSHCRKNVL